MRQLPRERADQAWGSCFGAPIVEDENSKVEDLVEQNKVSFSVETPIKKLQGGDVKGTFLAYAGLKRMSMEDWGVVVKTGGLTPKLHCFV